LKQRFWRTFRLLFLLSAIIAAIAVILIARSGGSGHVHLLVATALGIFSMTLVGTALMTLVFLSASSGHDAAAGEPYDPDDLEGPVNE
jgi:hypothetical protein